MQNPEQQKKELINGMPTNFLCHMQNSECAGTVFPAHFHSYIELLFVRNGNFEVIINNTHHLFSDGDLVIINSNEVHQINAFAQHGSYYVLRFEPEVIYNSMFDNAEDSKYVFPFLLGSSPTEKVIKKEKLEGTFIPASFQRMLEEFDSMEYGFELAVKIQIEQIFLWILRYFHAAGIGLPTPTMLNSHTARHLAPCFSYVALHYDEELTTSGMADLCNMSVSYFSRIFNRMMNMTFHQYVNYIRIQEAEKLLLSTAASITEIGTSVGFSTTSYFIKTFREYKSLSPKQYKKRLN